MKKVSLLQTLLVSTLILCVSLLKGDEIKLKSGETLTGKITYEADDIVKIEIAISASIKETKILARGDIAEIIKESPDSVAFKEMEAKLPVRSLTPAGQYRTLLETGPVSFLRSFPDSPHAEKVKEIQTSLEEELDKVERGFIKIEEEWISPQDQAEFKTLIESRVQLLRMQAVSRGGNPNSIIAAMREFEVLEENYYGTPAFPKALESALQAIPALGNRLQGMLRDVEYQNAEWERNKAALDDVARASVEAARKREEDNYKAGLDADKKAGIKWVRLNPRSKDSIENYLKLASGELKRLRTYDLEQLEAQANLLVEADELISKNNYTLARTRLNRASEISGTKEGSGSSKRGGKTSYLATLNGKLSDKLAEEKAREKAREEAAKSEALTANLNKQSQKKVSKEKSDDTEESSKGEASEVVMPEKKEASSPEDMFAALAKAEKGKEAEPSEKASEREEKKEESDREERPAPVIVDEGGGFPVSLIIPIITVLLLGTVIALKFLGIGGKKEASES